MWVSVSLRPGWSKLVSDMAKTNKKNLKNKLIKSAVSAFEQNVLIRHCALKAKYLSDTEKS